MNKKIITITLFYCIPLLVGVVLFVLFSQHHELQKQKSLYEEWIKETRKNTQNASIYLFDRINARQSISNQDEILAQFHQAKESVSSLIYRNSAKYAEFEEIGDQKISRYFKIAEQDIQSLCDKSTKIIHFYNFSLDRVPCDEITLSEQELHIAEFIKKQVQFTSSMSELEKLTVIFYTKRINTYLCWLYVWVSLTFIVMMVYSILVVRNSIAKHMLSLQKKKLLDDEQQKQQALTNFVKSIINDKFDAELQLDDTGDEFSSTLVKLKDKLKNAALDQVKQSQENEKRTWATQGLAQFAEILRDNTLDLNTLAYNVISKLVKYLNANQGGIFILNDDEADDKYLELTASYAYERRKYVKKRVELGEGLTGMCFLERKTMILSQIPDDYISIKSGLGDAPPRYLLIVPLKLNDDVFGTLEIASFSEMEPYMVEFVEKIGETICATIKNTKINNQTSRLLEQSRMQTDGMRQQQEEMRQHLEELAATQEELDRNNKMQSSRDKAVKSKYELEMLNLQEMLLKEQDELEKKMVELETSKNEILSKQVELEEYKESMGEEITAQVEMFQGMIAELEAENTSLKQELEKYSNNKI